jgi:hypothetical protein
VKTVLFTYYSNPVQDIFLENIESLLKNSACTYDEIVICSQIDVPVKIIKALSKHAIISRVFPDHNSQQVKRASNPNRSYKVSPFILTALSYKESIVTVCDSQLFVINPVANYTGHNIFYRNHRGVLSTQLFTIVNTEATSNLLLQSLIDCDFTDDSTNHKFTFIIANAVPFTTAMIHDKAFIFSSPSDHDVINEDKLIAFDLSEAITSSTVNKQMWAIRKAHIPKVSTLTKIANHASSIVSNAVAVIQEAEMPFKKTGSHDPIILFKYTSRSRPDQFYRGLISIINKCSSPNYLILCSFDNNDPTLPTYLEYIKDLNNDRITVCLGESKSKIDAINRDINAYNKPWDIVVNMSDDMIFTKEGFDLIIKSDFIQFFPKFDGVMHYPDQDAGQKLMTLSILGREYYRRFNYIYHPEYSSLWCDNEAMEVSMMLGKYRYSPVRMFDHIHPAYGHCQTDEQYKHTESFYHADNEVYLRRKEKGFKLKFAILIATIETRKPQFEKLRSFIQSQIVKNSLIGQCEIVQISDNKEISVGLKRQRLLELANSNYVAFIDDDDWVSDDYLKMIVNSIDLHAPDSIGFLIRCTFDGSSPIMAKASNKYADWAEDIDGYKYVRTPYHKTPIRRDLAVQIGFKDIRYAEDHDYSRRLKAASLIRKEDFIDSPLYYYSYVHENPNTKYGLQ